MQNSIPSLTLCFDPKNTQRRMKASKGIFCESHVSVDVFHQNINHIMEFVSNGSKYALVLGSPILGNHVDRSRIAQLILDTQDIKSTIKELNGEFLLVSYDANENQLVIATDRFCSYTAFWAQNGSKLAFSYNYSDLVRHCVNWPGFELCPEKAYEYFVLQRLMGLDTHDKLTRTIPAATLFVKQGTNEPRLDTYWRPEYKKKLKTKKRDLLQNFVELFDNSIKVRSEGHEEELGIFLSGGHDSRLVASYTRPGATCYTLAFKDNLEVRCAKNIATASGHQHQFCQLDPMYFEKAINDADYISGAMFSTDHALFLPSLMNPKPKKSIYLHGHGLDFMFQGMYLHATPHQIFGRNTYNRYFQPLPKTLFDHFIKTISFRNRFNLNEFLNKETANNYHEKLRENVRSVEIEAKALSDVPMDHWEYMIFHQPSRHYTFSNVLSKRSCGELRTPSFDNELYEFYLSLPYEYRLHGDMIRGALYNKNPKIARMPTANHGLPAGWGPTQKTCATITRKLLRHAGFKGFYIAPNETDRTWPDRDSYFRENQSYYYQALKALSDKEFMDFLDFIDWNKLKQNKLKLLELPFGGAFMVSLLTYYKFYRSVIKFRN